MQRTIIVGDIHGCFHELQNLLSRVGFSEGDRLVPVGDVVDGGPKSPEVVQLLMNLNARPLRGNHEEVHIRLHKKGTPRNERFYTATKLDTIRQFDEAYRENKVSITYDDAIEYFKTFRTYLNFPEALVVHAGIRYDKYGMNLDHQTHRRFIIGLGRWGKKTGGLPYWADSYPEKEKPIIFGHRSILTEIGRWTFPQRRNLWPLDTKAARGGFLTAVSLPDFKVYSVPARPETRNYLCEAAYA